MMYRNLTETDEQLVAAAIETIRRNYVEGRHHVAAAARAGSGEVYTGVHWESPGLDICAEPVALGAAATAGEREIACIVAVGVSDGNSPYVMSPCGTCRELLHHHWPEMDVIVPDGARLGKVGIAELLPVPYASPARRR